MVSNRIMLDLETLGTTPGSVIVSIGAVRFDDDRVIDSFSINIDPVSCERAGLTMDADTVRWWMDQCAEAREVFREVDAEGLYPALARFRDWAANPDEVWGNGADFDNALLTSAHRTCWKTSPWDYRANRCYRTVKGLFPEIEIERVGVHHRAVDDATSQALHLIKCLRHLRGGVAD